MFNSWLILAVVLAIAGSGAGGFLYGQRVQENADKAAQSRAVDQAIQDANALAEADKRRAVAAASKRAATQVKVVTVRQQAAEAIREAPLAASCDWSEKSFVELNNAITLANGQDIAAAVKRANGK